MVVVKFVIDQYDVINFHVGYLNRNVALHIWAIFWNICTIEWITNTLEPENYARESARLVGRNGVVWTTWTTCINELGVLMVCSSTSWRSFTSFLIQNNHYCIVLGDGCSHCCQIINVFVDQSTFYCLLERISFFWRAPTEIVFVLN